MHIIKYIWKHIRTVMFSILGTISCGLFVGPLTAACCIATSFYFEVPDPEALVLGR